MGMGRFTNEDLRVLHEACKKGYIDEANVKKSSGILETRSVVTGRTALHEACAHGQRETVKQLLQLGVDGHKTTLLGGETPLHLAVKSGDWSLVSLLLLHGFDPNIPNNYGATCFHYAGWKPAIVKLLLRYGGKVSIRDRFGETPWDSVQNNCPGNQELKRIVKQAFDLEESKRIREEYTLKYGEDDHPNVRL